MKNLQLATKPFDASSAVMDGLRYTLNELEWYTEHIQLWLTDIAKVLSSRGHDPRQISAWKESIQDFFEQIMEYIMLCIIHLNRGPLTKAARAVIKPEAWWRSQQNRLKERKAALNGHLEQIKAQKENHDKSVDLQNKLIATFKPTKANDIPDILSRMPKRVPNTCRWFCEHKTFQNWLSHGHSRHLLLSADPGSGKTMLSAYLVHEVLPEHFARADRPIIIYYFFDRTSRKDLSDALSTLLYQLFIAKPELAISCQRTIERASHNNTGLSDLFSMAVRQRSCPPVICVLDALDECNEDDQKRLIMLIGTLPQSNLRVLMTTRPYTDIFEQYQCKGSKWSVISTQEIKINTQIRNEIKIVVQSKVAELAWKKKFDSRTVFDLCKAIQNRGQHQPTYIWLDRLFSSLEAANCDSRPSALLASVQNSQTALMDSTYKGLLQRVALHDQSRLKVIFHLLIATSRVLTVRELEIAFRAKLTHWDPKKSTWTSQGNEKDVLGLGHGIRDPDPFQKWLLEGSHFFIAIQDEGVRFLHPTAREFLLETGDKNAWYSVKPLEAERTMVESCLHYLSLGQFKTQGFESQVLKFESEVPKEAAFRAVNGLFGTNYGFLKYALQYWPQHFQRIQKDPKLITSEIEHCYIALFTPPSPKPFDEVTPTWLLLCQILQGWAPRRQRSGHGGSHSSTGVAKPNDTPSRHVIYGGTVARWNHHLMLKYFVPLFWPDETPPPPQEQCSMLLYMAMSGSAIDCVKYVTDTRHVKTFINRKMVGAGRTPLIWATLNFGKHTRNLEMVKILLDRGADKTLADDKGELPFSHFIEGIKSRWPFDTKFDNHKDKQAYITQAWRLMVNDEVLKKLSEPARSSYRKKLELFKNMDGVVAATLRKP